MINLLPYNQKKLIGRMWRMRVGIVILICFILLCIISGVLFFPTLLAVNNQYILLSGQVAKLEAQNTFFSEKQLTDLDHTSALLERKLTAPTGNDPVVYMKKIQSVTPQGISISRYSIGDTASPAIQIFGQSSSRSALESFVQTLKTTPGVASVDSPVANYVKSANAPFTITVTFTKV